MSSRQDARSTVRHAPDCADSPALQRALGALAEASGRDVDEVSREARRYLHELRTGHNARVHGLLVRAGRALLASGYSGIDVEPRQVERARARLEAGPTVVLASHRSYLDGGVLTVAFDDHDLPPLTVFGGINMAFWPVGALWRRANMVFVRRGGDSGVYRCTLRHYLAYLVGQRKPLQWFIEGTRSRTGKLGRPRLGLLTYLVDAYREGQFEDLSVLPAAITYERLHEVRDYAGEARGAAKATESLGWLLRFVRAQRGRHGHAYLRFGEPISLRDHLGPPGAARLASEEVRRRQLAGLALEVACRINDATPVTGTALVTLALLGARDRALTLEQIRVAVRGYVDFARRKRLPQARSADLSSEDAVIAVLDGLAAQGLLQAHREGAAAVFGIAPGQHVAAAFYRNTIAHFFLHGAIAEVALLEAAERPEEQRLAAFDAAALELRGLLESDFFFREPAAFLSAMHGELEQLAPDWRPHLAGGPQGVQSLLGRLPTLSSDMLLRPFLAAYSLAAETLLLYGDRAAPADARLVAECTGLGNQYLAQRRLGHPESVSRQLIDSGIGLARRRGLVDADSVSLARRAEFAERLRCMLRRLSEVRAIAVRRVEQTVAMQASPAEGTQR